MKPKKLLSFILATAMAISLLPTFTLTASATTTTTAKKITLGTSALSGYDSTNGYDYIYYGTYNNNSIKWRVLDNKTNFDSNNDGTNDDGLFLLSDVLFGTGDYGDVYFQYSCHYDSNSGKYHKGAAPSDDDHTNCQIMNAWQGSNAQEWCQNFYSQNLTTQEQKAVLATTKSDAAFTSSTWQIPFAASENILSGDNVFFLSAEEAENGNYGFTSDSARIANYGNSAGVWWLRSPYAYDTDFAGAVINHGIVDCGGTDFAWAARPAFNLNLSSVLFTSAANGGKSSTAAVGGGAEILKNANYTISGDEKYEYKLTMLDTSRNFEVTEKSASGTKGDKITFNYKYANYAETGSNEYISAMIVNNNDEVLYYGQLANITNSTEESGTVDFVIPSDIDYGTYKLKLFNEQINGDCKTDYSSGFSTVELTVEKPKATFTTEPKPNILTYNGKEQELVTAGETSEGTVKYSFEENGTYTTNIPTYKNATTDYTVWYYIEGDSTHSDSDKASVKVTISQKEITTANATITLGNSLTYNGTEQTQTVSKVEVDGLTLTENDYTVSGNKATEAKDDYELTISGTGNFTGTATKQFAIAKADSQTTTTANATVTYGETLTLKAMVEKSARTLNKVDFYVVEGENAEFLGTADVTYTDGTHGTATLEVDTKNKQLSIGDNKITADYGGSVNLNESKSDTITVTLNKKEIGLSWSGYAARDYNGQPSNVAATAMGTIGNDEIDVTVTGGNETNANTYTATATGLTGTYAEYYKLPTVVTQNYTISPKNISGADVGAFAEMTYNGQEQTPSATVTIDGLTATGEWSNVTNVSDTTTFTANGNFTGTMSDVTPNMAKKSIENATLALDGELTYNGNEQTQNVTLTLDGFTNVTFDISDNKQTNVKTDDDYTLTVTGTGNFEGTKTLDWNIKPYTPTENPDKKTTARVRRNRTVAEATVTAGEILGLNDTVLEGTFAWVDDTTTMSADGTEQMTFTPTDTNYAPITVDIAVSTYSSSGGGSSVTRYTVKFDTDGGSTIANQTVTKNSKATEPTKPTKEGYIFDGWYSDSELTTEYDFDTKVTKNITLYAKWSEDEIQEPSDDKKDDEPQTDEWKNPFTDVTKADWFFDNVRYANENGLMSGTTATTFAPNDSLTRAMLVTVLWRAEGEPNVDFAMPFTDVADTAYYAEAVRWAASENIVNGITETEFAPDMNITREQIAAIIYRYAKYKGYDVSVGEDTNILSYADFDEISEYAIEAMQYAVGSGLMKGKTETTLNPKDNATRAEIAAILNRFIEGNK